MNSGRLAEWTVAATLALAAAGCGTPTHLLFYQGTVIGVDVATTPDQGTVSAKLGYDRHTGTIVPKTIVKNTNGEEQTEAMSVLARARFKIRFLRASEICERFATGQAALNMAEQASAVAALVGPQGESDACADW